MTEGAPVVAAVLEILLLHLSNRHYMVRKYPTVTVVGQLEKLDGISGSQTLFVSSVATLIRFLRSKK